MSQRHFSENSKMLYKARWAWFGRPATYSMDFYAHNDEDAKDLADGFARDLGVTRVPRSLGRGPVWIEILDQGVSP